MCFFFALFVVIIIIDVDNNNVKQNQIQKKEHFINEGGTEN